MNGYLGETIYDAKETIYAKYKKKDWALKWIELYGWIDGSHHKDWLLDQVTRILNGTPVIIKLAAWDNGETEWRFTLDEPTTEYHQWVEKLRGEYDPVNEEYEYEYSVGVAP